MSVAYVEGPTRSFTAGAAIGQHLRVKLSSEKLAVAGVADRELGTMAIESNADLDVVAVRLRNAAGTFKAIAAGVIAVGADVFTAASGKVNDTADSTSYLLGTALTAAAADGDIIEVLRHVNTGEATA